MTTASGIWVPACAGTTAERGVLAVHLRLFLLATFGHAGPVLINLHVTPEVLRIAGRQEVALVNGLCALLSDSFRAALRVAGRCQRGDGNSYGKGSQTFLKVHHDESPSNRRPVTRHIWASAGELASSALLRIVPTCERLAAMRRAQ